MRDVLAEGSCGRQTGVQRCLRLMLPRTGRETVSCGHTTWLRKGQIT